MTTVTLVQNSLLLLYTDPGSGALLLQILAASVLGSLFYLRRFKDAIFGLFRPAKASPNAAADATSEKTS